jgi:hypothetical protein
VINVEVAVAEEEACRRGGDIRTFLAVEQMCCALMEVGRGLPEAFSMFWAWD